MKAEVESAGLGTVIMLPRESYCGWAQSAWPGASVVEVISLALLLARVWSRTVALSCLAADAVGRWYLVLVAVQVAAVEVIETVQIVVGVVAVVAALLEFNL